MPALRQIGATLIALLIWWPARTQAQTLTLDQCYELAKQNYPLIRKHGLIAGSSRYSLENAGKLFLPQFSINGQASYQSETINFADVLPAAPGNFPSLSKDQYRLQGELSQQLYDGGAAKNQKDLIRAGEAVQQQSLEVNLYALKDRVTQLYFSILLMDEQLRQNSIRRASLQNAVEKTAASLQNGTAFRSNVDELQAEVANADLSALEFRAMRRAYAQMLCLMIGRQPEEDTQLAMPPQQVNDPQITRPELALFDLQQKTYEVQERQLRSDHLPKLNAFVQGAYGRPTLNIIKNSFGPWWIGGIRLNWNLGSLYSLKNNKGILRINKETLAVDKETFLFNTNLTLAQQAGDVQKYSAMVRQDDIIILLRQSVTKAAQAQLDNGVITAHDFITKINEESLAKQARILHHILMLQAQYNRKITSGN